jgi:16S rRNA (guanine527-N7)-methyltransferase
MDRPAARLAKVAEKIGYGTLETGSIERLERYLELLALWNQRFHLTGDRDLETLIDRHVGDSLAVAVEVDVGGHLVDIGSGAGFPGVVVAAVRPDVRVTPIESRRRPVSFLGEVGRTVPLPNLQPMLGRAEDAPERGFREAATSVVSRAVRVDIFLPLAAPLLAPGGTALVMCTTRQPLDAIDAHARAAGLVLDSHRDYELMHAEPRRIVRLRKPRADR